MLKFIKLSFVLFLLSLSIPVLSLDKTGKHFDRVIYVLFENTNFQVVMRQPFFNKLAQEGALFSNFVAQAHPSQGNYIAMTSGSLYGVSDDKPVDLNVANIADLLEAKGLTWKVYAEDYPGNCFTGPTSAGYARKHNPFMSYINIQTNRQRCANIVNAKQFEQDAASGELPNYIFFVPNLRDSGHDSNVMFADAWYEMHFAKFVNDSKFMERTILISSFDESGNDKRNQIYTSIFGSPVKSGAYSDRLNHYSLLQMVEDNWQLGNLGKEDVSAPTIPNIWR